MYYLIRKSSGNLNTRRKDFALGRKKETISFCMLTDQSKLFLLLVQMVADVRCNDNIMSNILSQINAYNFYPRKGSFINFLGNVSS